MKRPLSGLLLVTIGFVLGSVSMQLVRAADEPTLDGRLNHLGFAVRDIDKAASEFAAVFGVPVPKVMVIRDIHWGPSYGDKKMHAKRVGFDIAGVTFELLQGFDGDSPWKNHIAKHGEGLHHVGITVPDVRATREMLLARGGKWTQNYMPTMSYVDMEPRLPFTFEIMAMPSATPTPGK